MPRPAPRHFYGPRTRRLDPSKPLYVARRISTGSDEAGVPTFLEPGALFDATGIKPQKVIALFGNRFLTHDVPGTRSDVRNAAAVGDTAEPAAPPPEAPPPEAPAEPAKPTKPPKRAAAGA